MEGLRENTVKKKDILIYRGYELLKFATKRHCENLPVYLSGIEESCKEQIEEMEKL
ncbi:MAG: hypothetical protein N2Z80_02665 [Hydrogenothermaceae bacterium]|nr:hypothetical protein [Hydrogenothermaceae bacterium]